MNSVPLRLSDPPWNPSIAVAEKHETTYTTPSAFVISHLVSLILYMASNDDIKPTEVTHEGVNIGAIFLLVFAKFSLCAPPFPPAVLAIIFYREKGPAVPPSSTAQKSQSLCEVLTKLLSCLSLSTTPRYESEKKTTLAEIRTRLGTRSLRGYQNSLGKTYDNHDDTTFAID